MSATATAETSIARTVGSYTLQYEIGRGGMGVVYRAVHVDGGSPVALKIPFAQMADYFGCMRREIHALSRLRHPGVVRIIEEGVEKGVPWYAMELLDSRSLDELLSISGGQEPLTDPVRPFEPRSGVLVLPSSFRARVDVRGDLQRALTLMYRLARVLAYVHAHGIVHRDLKPHNVLVRPGDRPVLVDFGLMGEFRAQSGREVLQIGGLMMGTAIYAAPEQASGELVDARADLYSFGAMLYEIVAGAPPFNGRTIQDVLMLHLTQPPVPPSALVNGVPDVLEKLILRLLEKRRADRLGYAEDAAAMLVEAGADPDPDFEVETAAYLYRPEVIGRRETIATLRARLWNVGKGDGAFVTLGGESGIGKTSVASAFAREAAIAGFHIVTAECDPVGGQPLHPLRPLLRDIADHCRGNADVQERVLGPRLQVLREQEPALAALADEAPLRMPAEIVTRRLFDDLAVTLAAFAHERPLVLILDDLQWADESTLRFLSLLGSGFFEDLPLMILGSYRVDEVRPDLRALLEQPHVMKVVIGRLDDVSVTDIVRSMLAAPDASDGFLRFIADRAEGNPFFVAEYLRAAVTEKLLYRQGGRWHVQGETQAYSSLDLPGTLRDLVARRLEGLSPLAQRVAEAAAVLGREVPETLLIATCGESESDAFGAMAELVARYVFDALENGVRFAHAKLREGVYARLAEDRRRLLHSRTADVIQTLCTSEDLLRLYAAEIAHHCDSAGRDAEAIHYYSIASEAALRTGASRAAIDLVSRAMTIDAADPTAETERERGLRHARWHRVLCAAHLGLGDLGTSAEHARVSLAEVGVHLPRTRAGWKTRLLFEALRQALHVALPGGPRAAREARQPVLLEVALSAEKFSERSYFVADTTPMLASALIAVNAAERLGDVPGLVHSYSNLGLVASGVGLHRLADRYFEEGRRLGTAANHYQGLAHLGYASVAHYVTTCDWKRCEQYAEEAVTIARIAGDHQITEICETVRGHWEFYTGRLEKAAETYAALRDGAHKRSNLQHESWGHAARARSLILMGRVDEALDCANKGHALLEGQDDHMSELLCCAHRTQALLHIGDLREAAEAADVTYAIAMKPAFRMWELFRGFANPAEVYLELWSQERTRDPLEVERMRRAVKVLLRNLRAMARHAPIVVPVTSRLEGVAACLEGDLRRGEKLLRKSAAAAARLGLPIDEGIAEYELVRRTLLDPGERSMRREHARSIFRSIGCELYLRKMKDDPRRSGSRAVEGV
jgi:tetratricopeptide (TPR) repeat protein